jgi:outer membrane protein
MKNKIYLGLVVILAALSASESSAQTQQRITLKEAESIALANHPQLRAAEFISSAAGQVVTEVQSAHYPLLYGSMTGAGALDKSRIAAGGLNNPVIFDRYADGLTAVQLVTDFGRTSNLVASARLLASARNEDVNTTHAEVLLQVDRSYYGVLRAAAIMKVAQETVNARQLVVDQVTALAKNKLKSDLDVSFANVNLAQAKLLYVQAQNDLKASHAELSEAMGYADERSFDPVEEPLPSEALPDLSQAVAEALHARPEMAALRLQRDSAERFAKAEGDLWFPTVSAVGSAGIIPWHDSNLSDRFAAVGVNINFPIFNGRLFSARRAEADFKFKAEDQSLRNLEDQISRDVRIAWLNADTANQRLGLTQQLLDQASLAFDLAQARYNLGLGSIVELSQAQLDKTQAEIEQASAKYEYLTERAALAYQIGSLK